MAVRSRTRPLQAVWAPSLVRRVVRHRRFQISVLVGAAIVVGLVLSAKQARLDAAHASWGEANDVLVVVEPIEVGELIAGSVEAQSLPAALIPDGALQSVSADQRARTELYVGEVLLPARVSGQRPGSPPQGTAALTVSVETQPPSLAAGDLVDLWSVNAADLRGERVMRNVVVLATADADVTVAVPTDQLDRATAASFRTLILTLTG